MIKFLKSMLDQPKIVVVSGVAGLLAPHPIDNALAFALGALKLFGVG